MAEAVGGDVNPLSQNKELADVLNLISNYYIMARDTYRAKAFGNAAVKIADYPTAILSGAQARRDIPGIGESIETAINEFIATGTVTRLQELEGKFGDRKATIDYFRSFYGIGPVTAVKLYNQGFRTLDDIWFKGNLSEATKIAIQWREHLALRIPREEMSLFDAKIASLLDPYGIVWVITGSYRRGEPSSGDIDILVESRPDLNMNGLVTLLQPIIVATLAQGEKLFMGIARLNDEYNGHRIDIKLIDHDSFPFALLHFTGSQRFNILLRSRAIELGMSLNEYGLYGARGGQYNAGSEEDIFRLLRVRYIPPEARTKTIPALEYI